MKKSIGIFVMCLECESIFKTFMSTIVRGSGQFCSNKCRGAFTKKQPHKSYTRLYGIWCGMKSRCLCTTSEAFQHYGELGVTICQGWIESFELFRAWAMNNGYEDDLEIDRKDTTGNYEPGNCRWVTRPQQMRNTRKRRDAETSQFKGVSWCAGSSKWRVQLHKNGKPFHGGLFVDETDAARRYDELAEQMYGEFARLNFSKDGVLS